MKRSLYIVWILITIPLWAADKKEDDNKWAFPVCRTHYRFYRKAPTPTFNKKVSVRPKTATIQEEAQPESVKSKLQSPAPQPKTAVSIPALDLASITMTEKSPK
jgi:hypothetical protein